MTTQAQSIIQQGITGAQTRPVASQPTAPPAPPAPVTEAMELTESSPIDLDPKILDIGIKPQPHLCYLWVMEDDDENCYRVFASNLLTKRVEAKFSFKRDLKQELFGFEEAWYTMSDFAEGQADLGNWFNATLGQIRERTKRAPELIISDGNGPRIPWEMFHLNFENRIFVGTEFITVRWGDPKGADLKRIKLEMNGDCQGRMLAHFDEAVFNDFVREIHKPLLNLKPKRAPKITDLVADLKKEIHDIGLVYLLCHGLINAQLGIGLGSENDVSQQVYRRKLKELALPLLKLSKAIVFLNACNSAGAQQNRDFYYVPGNITMVDLFLAKGASGVIGTLDSVEVTRASRTAERFIDFLRENPSLPVAEVLRKIRASIFSKEDDGKEPTEEQLQDWYHSFLYVFYGHPETKLKIEVGSAKSAATDGKGPQ